MKWLILLGPVVLLALFVLMGMRSHRAQMKAMELQKAGAKK